MAGRAANASGAERQKRYRDNKTGWAKEELNVRTRFWKKKSIAKRRMEASVRYNKSSERDKEKFVDVWKEKYSEEALTEEINVAKTKWEKKNRPAPVNT